MSKFKSRYLSQIQWMEVENRGMKDLFQTVAIGGQLIVKPNGHAGEVALQELAARWDQAEAIETKKHGKPPKYHGHQVGKRRHPKGRFRDCPW